MGGTFSLTPARAPVRYLAAQLTEKVETFIEGVRADFWHGGVAALGEALCATRETLPAWRWHNQQTTEPEAIACSKQLRSKRTMVFMSSIRLGATNMVTAPAAAHANRLPVLLLPEMCLSSACRAPC